MERGSNKTGRNRNFISFSTGKLRGKVAVVWGLSLSDLSVFSLISDPELLLLRPIRICAIRNEL